jgi:tetratricopeptide (TPR) repeat protein
VNKERFYSIVQNFTSLEKDEAEGLISLQKEYPYSQVIHNLVAKATNDLQFSDKDIYLSQSAIYSTDRSVLKSIITALRTDRIVPSGKMDADITAEYQPPVAIHSGKAPIYTESMSKRKEEESFNPNQKASSETKHNTDPINESFYTQVDNDLANLRKSKAQYEKAMEMLEKNQPVLLSNVSSSELAKKPSDDGLIEEIINSKQQVTSEDPRQKEQIDIIDQFIKTQPTISKPKVIPLKTEDLTEKTDVFGENIVSETLVEILVNQGKKEKAIEMLKKLIWKFPQKKTYFAAQIDELKK